MLRNNNNSPCNAISTTTHAMQCIAVIPTNSASGLISSLQLLKGRQSHATLAMGSKDMQATLNVVPIMLRTNLQALFNGIMLSAISVIYVCLAVIWLGCSMLAATKTLLSICKTPVTI